MVIIIIFNFFQILGWASEGTRVLEEDDESPPVGQQPSHPLRTRCRSRRLLQGLLICGSKCNTFDRWYYNNWFTFRPTIFVLLIVLFFQLEMKAYNLWNAQITFRLKVLSYSLTMEIARLPGYNFRLWIISKLMKERNCCSESSF